MIVTCPACHARYKINEGKIKGRGARITCPRCAHRFVVYRESAQPPRNTTPSNVPTLDFSTLGITWRVRHGLDVVWEFHDLATLRRWLSEGRVDTWDRISYDNRDWRGLDRIPDLERLFHETWEKARRGEIETGADDPPSVIDDEEDDSDAPTTIVGRGSDLASEIRQAVTAEATPAPAVSRKPARPRPAVSPQPPAPPPSASGPSAEVIGIETSDEAIAMEADDEEDDVYGHARRPSGDDFGHPATPSTDASLGQVQYDPAPLDPAYNDVVPTPVPLPGGPQHHEPAPHELAAESSQAASPVALPPTTTAAQTASRSAPKRQSAIIGITAALAALLLILAALSLSGVF
jgi:predicted Zn finger-like uncharacterized protein